MLHSQKCKGILSFDLGDKITTQEEAYATTVNPKLEEPIARSMFIIVRAEKDDGYPGDHLHYGQKFRL